MAARRPGPQAPAAPATRPDSPQRKPQRAIAATTPVTSRLGSRPRCVEQVPARHYRIWTCAPRGPQRAALASTDVRG
jgi:hypothetical protein